MGEVGFSVTIGLLMGMGRTITQKSELWRNTVLYLEILNKLSPFDWVRRLDELFDTKFHPPESFQSLELTKLVKVNENFGTMRKMIEILNHDYSINSCFGAYYTSFRLLHSVYTPFKLCPDMNLILKRKKSFRMISYRIRIPKFHQIARKISKSF